MGLDAGQHHVAVVQLAEQVLEVAGSAPRRLGGLAEAELGRLEDVAKALRGDAHVVLVGDALEIQGSRGEGQHLVQADADDPCRVVGQRRAGIEFLDRLAFTPERPAALLRRP